MGMTGGSGASQEHWTLKTGHWERGEMLCDDDAHSGQQPQNRPVMQQQADYETAKLCHDKLQEFPWVSQS